MQGDAKYITDTKKVTRARAKIILAVDTSIFTYIKKAATAKEVWKTLRSTFEESELTQKIRILRELVTAQITNCKSIEECINRIMTGAQRLRELDFEDKDEWLGTLLLAGYPKTINS